MVMQMDNNFGQWLQRKRESLGFSQIELAKLCGIDRSLINRYENNHCEPSIHNVKKLAKALGMKPRDLFDVIAGEDVKIQDEIADYIHTKILNMSDEKKKIMKTIADSLSEDESSQIKSKSRGKTPARIIIKEN